MENAPSVNGPSTKTLQINEDEVRLLTIADPHMSAHSPASWKADYRKTVEGALEQILLYAVKERVHAIIWPGDLFNHKAAHKNPYDFVADVMRMLKKTGIPNVGVAGNHDLKWGSLKGFKGQPIELLVEAGFQLLDREEMLIQARDFSVRIAGASYCHSKAEQCRAKTKQGATWLVSVGHFWFGPEDGVFYGDPMFSPTYLGEGEADIYVIGHHHDDQGIVEHKGKKYVVPGSISLTGEKPNDVTRRPAAGYLRISKDIVGAWILRPKMPSITDLMDMEKRAQAVQESQALSEFVESVGEAKVMGADPREILLGMEMSDAVRERVINYLGAAENSRG